MTSFVTVRANGNRHVTGDMLQESSGGHACLLKARHVLGAREAAGTWHLQPRRPDTHSMANAKQSIKHLHYDPCSREASRVRGCARWRVFWSLKSTSSVQPLDGTYLLNWKKMANGPYAYYFPPRLVFKKQGPPKQANLQKSIKLRIEVWKLAQ